MFIVLMDFIVFSLDGLYCFYSRWTLIRSVYKTGFKNGFNHRSGLILPLFDVEKIQHHIRFICMSIPQLVVRVVSSIRVSDLV